MKQEPRALHGPGTAPSSRRSAQEARLFLRAQVSSLAATAVDAATYQLALFAGGYRAAALVGALLGAAMSFALNRTWAFPPSGRSLKSQMAMYAAASLATFLGLQACLFTLVELGHLEPRTAWVPARCLAWMGISYPLFRFVVFSRPRERSSSRGIE